MTKNNNSINKIESNKQNTNKEKKSKKLPLILGSVLGGVGVVAAISMITFSCTKQKYFTLTFDVGDAIIVSGNNKQTSNKEMIFGNTNKPEVMKDEYMFEGWYYDSAFTKPVLDTDKISSNTTIYLNMVKDGYCYLDFTVGESGATLTGNTKVAVMPGKKFKDINKPAATWNDGKQFDYWQSGATKILEDQEINKSDRLSPVFTDPIAGHTELMFETVGKSTYTGTTRFTVPEKTIFQTCTTPTAILTGKLFNRWQYKNNDGEIVDIPANWQMPQGQIHIYPNFDDIDFTTKITITKDGIQYWLTNPTTTYGDLEFMDTDGNSIKFKRDEFNETVTIGSNMTAIDTDFMANCVAFNNGSKELILPANIEKIGDCFLHNCLTFNQKVNLSNCTKLSEINSSFMCDCNEFNSPLVFPTTYERSSFVLGSNFLYKCFKFNQPITLPTYLTEIPSCFLEGCEAFNQKISFPTGINYIGPYFLSRCISFSNGGSENLILPAITQINESFMYYCTSFKGVDVILPNTLISIGNYFMYNCKSFDGNLKLPTNLTSIGNYFLYQNSVFNDADFKIPENLETIGTNFMDYCFSFARTIELSSSIKSVGKWFMFDCKNFTGTITIGCSPDKFSDGDRYTLATGFRDYKCYNPGITINGAYASDFKAKFIDYTDSNPYRKLNI